MSPPQVREPTDLERNALLANPNIAHLTNNGRLSVPGSPYSPSSPRTGSDTSINRIKNLPGYKNYQFAGKSAQQEEVEDNVASKGFIPAELVNNEVVWFYNHLGIDDTYFANESIEVISDHVLALYGAKLLAYTKHDPAKLVIDLEKITREGDSDKSPEGAVFIHTSPPGKRATDGPGATCEKRIDNMYLDNSTVEKAYRLETYRSQGSVSATTGQQLRCYFVTRCQFPSELAKKLPDGTTDIRTVSDTRFLERASEHTLGIYQSVMSNVETRYGPVIEVFEVEETRERRVVIGYRMGGTSHYFSALSDLYHFYGLYSARKYVEQFANGVTIVSMYLNPVPNSQAPPIEHSIFQVKKEASLLYCLPDNPFFAEEGVPHAVQEATYAYCGWIFAQHFCNRLGAAYLALKNVLDESNPEHEQVLNQIKRRFRDETFTRQYIEDVIKAHPELIRLLYINFAMVHYPSHEEATRLGPTLSYLRMQVDHPLTDEELYTKIRRTMPNEHDQQVLTSFLVFNKHVLKTNFYQPTKVALSFRMEPSFLPAVEYPKTPFGLFFIIGSDFRGFHVRFKDVARGGIRIVRSRGVEQYSINQRMLFDENYALASTQSLKNKDIPEGGAKGTILPSIGANARLCFEKYVDAVIDLLVPGHSPGIKEPIIDLYDKPEILFFGPDEGTADMMDWAAIHVRNRGVDSWKSFTTGKSAELLGGVPHDTYGMTSLSVRQYVVGIYKALGLKEKDVTKVQTGGPDGDLGSNEILLSSDRTIAIIDGSGVLADPAGINRQELIRLAKLRIPVSNFDRSKLSKEGYLVMVEDQDVKLPSGEIVQDGTDFRNSAHLRFKADLFVPCGGRPEAVNISNVSQLFDLDGALHFKYIVEGANLFITREARLYLEKRGVILFKDASANKGGVTSSSLEVLAGLSLNDSQYTDLMIFKNGKPSEFYESYVRDIQSKITENAANEFSCIWREYNRLKGVKPRSAISDELSGHLTELQEELENSDLFDDKPSRLGVMRKAIPDTLVNKVGLDPILRRLPVPYQKALFASWVASHFIYQFGVNGSAVDFFHFARDLALRD
ncbi:NAD-dependent glutamate dehydrogenase [Dacryopinax primogenitus]|uniref:NAD-specific glutamate dehydrogenase n=1 Tax=Dacryopinax primogenitus (strain DJM 731) TaxID=1858805 RepID=M5GAF8_DACPD|nr:NAD-dependent glutamate dehydrogenase [Dacryopinax primogenitus]EJU02932.1 NAD-dependent glutamate dehydrogenase [Dacryopinax primogenitus]